jgi:hypothetical protein
MANEFKIITNKQPRALLGYNELTAKEKEQFDYIKHDDNDDGLRDEEYRFFRYKGNAYDVYEFMRTDTMHSDDLKWWSGYSGDTYFSGVLIKYMMDTDEVIVGRYYC